MVQSKLPVPGCWVNFSGRGVLPIWPIVGQGPTALAVGAGWGCLDIFFSHLSFLFSFSLPLRLDVDKYCLKEPLSPKQPTNQIYPAPSHLPTTPSGKRAKFVSF